MTKDINQASNIQEYKLVFLDIDGTVLGSNHTIHPEDLKQIKRIKEQGVHVSLASGRPAFAAEQVISELNIDSLCMFYSGGMIWNPALDSPQSLFPVSNEDLLELIKIVSKEKIYFELYSANDYFVPELHRFSEIHSAYLGKLPTVRSVDNVIADNQVLKLVTILPTEQENRMEEIAKEFPGLLYATGLGAAHKEIVFCNISSPESNRKSRFYEICEQYAVDPEETIAIGDAASDITFLELAGAGIAMGNADNKVKERANYVTDHVDQAGVAKALQRLFP